MAKRIPPTSLEVIAAFNRNKVRLDENRAVEWYDAIELVRTLFRTTKANATGWLTEAVLELNSPLIGVWATGTVKVVRRGEEEKRFAGDRVGWTLDEEMSLRFSFTGERLPVGASRHTRERRSIHPWVMLRTALPVMHDAIVRERAERKRENAERKDAKDTVFRSVHGEALAAIEEWLSCLDQTGTNVDHRFRDTEVAPMLRISTHNMSGYFGSPGSVTIELEGDRIEAFAELIRRTQEGA